MGFSIQSYSQPGFIIVKGYKAESAKGKGTEREVQNKPGASFQKSSSSGITWMCVNSSSDESWHV